MGSRGPLPKPTALKLAAGNPGRRTLNDREPVPPVGTPRPPKCLGLSPKALAIWKELAPTLVRMKTLTTADEVLFGRYCELLARWLVLKDFLRLHEAAGTTYPIRDDAGKVRYMAEVPQASEWRRIGAELRHYEQQFGVGAAFRTRIQVEEPAPAAPAPQPASAAPDPLSFFRRGAAG
jgi:hypothetical protein